MASPLIPKQLSYSKQTAVMGGHEEREARNLYQESRERTGGKILCVQASNTQHMFYCSFKLHLQNIYSEIKLLWSLLGSLSWEVEAGG
jgi:hypothetical protein